MDNIYGIINIYKAEGYTSHDVVNIVRKKLNKIKTGHTGTLDPNATGVLPICIGKATKITEYITNSIKEYVAVVKLGQTTTTQDIWGDITSKKDVNVSKEDIVDAVHSFKGEIYQIPPMYSAIKINGQKLYNLARNNLEIERKKRKINIYNIKVNKFIKDTTFEITVTCSKGTYIRTLCHDIGEKLGCGACMASLLRTRSGNFYLKDCITLDDLDNYIKNDNIKDIIIPIEDVLYNFKRITVSALANRFLYNGNKISFSYLQNKDLIYKESILAYDKDGTLVGIYIVLKDCIKPLKILL